MFSESICQDIESCWIQMKLTMSWMDVSGQELRDHVPSYFDDRAESGRRPARPVLGTAATSWLILRPPAALCYERILCSS
jgi:hypothetical protein